MARHRRLFFEDVPIHVIIRGNQRQAIFLERDDRRGFRDLLREGMKTYRIAVHAYVFMTNHVHMLVTPETANSLPGLFRSVGASYVYRFNKRYNRTGSLLEDRYKSIYVADGQHFLNCMRYVELNPVRARMVSAPEEHPWSSYSANALGRKDDLVTPHRTFLGLGTAQGDHSRAYQALFDAAVDQAVAARIREALQKGWAYGDDEFILKTGLALGLSRKLAAWDDGALLRPKGAAIFAA